MNKVNLISSAPSIKITPALFWGIAATIIFNLLPIELGYGLYLVAAFVPYAGLMFVLSFSDRRVLGYAAVLTACNFANAEKISFSYILVLLAIIKEPSGILLFFRNQGKYLWWWFFGAAFLFVGLTYPNWPAGSWEKLTVAKFAVSRLGYVVCLPVAVALTLRNPRDGVRAVALLTLMSTTIFVIFYSFGQIGMAANAEAAGAVEAFKFIGQAYIGFTRTQVCIPIAVLAAGNVALASCIGIRLRAAPFILAAGICVFMIMLLASVGSAIAMVCGLGVLALGYVGANLTFTRILWGGILFSIIGLSLYLAIFSTDNYLSQRIEERKQSGMADREVRWSRGFEEALQTPIGSGTSDSSYGHSEYFIYLISYGWPTGFCYMAGIGCLLVSMWRMVRRHGRANAQARTLLLVGLAALTVYAVNSISDMPSGSIVFYEIIWAIILTSAVGGMAIKPNAKNLAMGPFPTPPQLVFRSH